MFSDSSTAAATFAALLMVFVSRGVSGQSTSLTPTLSVTPSSMSTLPISSQDISTTTTSATAASTEVISSTPSGPSTSASVTATNPTSEATTEAPTTTEAPSSTKTCGWVIVVWKKSWKSMYKDNQQFISNTTEKLQMSLEHGFFNDSSKYGHVKVSDLQVDDKDGDVNVTFKLCLVLKNNAHAGYIEDVIKMWKTFGNESITGHEFLAEVTFKDWKAKDGECSKCSSGGAGPITLERECKPKKAEYSCDGVKTTVESQDCLKYCDSKAATRKFTSVFLLLAVLISFSPSFTIWE